MTARPPIHPPLPDDPLLAEVLAGLGASPPRLPVALFYDATGSRLFDRITELREYYLTRCERAIFRVHGRAIAAEATRGARAVVVVEPGCGSGEKAAGFLAAIDAPEVAWVPIEVSAAALEAAVRLVRARVPRVRTWPVLGDFRRPLPALPHGQRVLFFPGSTIGNLDPDDAVRFLARLAAALGPGARFVVGVDLAKDPRLLRAAYDDAAGVTAAFNRNALAHLNRRFGGDFVPSRFAHEARVDTGLGRVEMHLVATRDERVRVAGRAFAFPRGASIHTESAYKYTLDGFRGLGERAGLRPVKAWTDARGWFSVHVLEAA
ncbi:MAG: L-histidine N(alpha)-methyltransferase [Myxococcota bacterium]